MKLLAENKGIALVTSLMLTLISMTIVMYLLYMITSSIKISGANKRYRTALEASFGSTDMIIKEVIPTIFTKTIAESLINPSDAIGSLSYPSYLNFTMNSNACIMDKLTKPSSAWGAGCSNSSDPKVNTDFKMELKSTSTDTYTVYTKIVDSACPDKRPYPVGKCTGSDLSGYELLDSGMGTTGGLSGVTPKAAPAMYRIEVVGERTYNPIEKSKLSVVYAY